jgi:lysophospholipase L1-like esterase
MKNSKQSGSFAVIAGLMAVLVILLGILAANVFELKKFADSGTAQKTTIGGSGVEIYLPETYYAASGLTMEIYNSQITNQGTHITEYNVVWECEVGEMLERKFSIAATDELIGEYPLTVTVYDAAGKALARKVSTLSIVEAKQEEFSILAIGDSLSANGALYAKLQQNLGNHLICNGTRGYEGFLTEARLGFSAENYLTETGYYLEEGEEVHKFWNPETKSFDWNYYKQTYGFNPDVVLLHLGTNGLLSGDENAENICKIVELIRKDDKDLPIYVVNTIYQSDQNGIGSMKMNNGALMFQGQYKQQRDLAVFQLMGYLAKELGDEKQVYLVPAGISMDSEYVFFTEERPVNPYLNITESVAVDAVHPSAAGYFQIADTIYSTLCGTMDQWK